MDSKHLLPTEMQSESLKAQMKEVQMRREAVDCGKRDKLALIANMKSAEYTVRSH